MQISSQRRIGSAEGSAPFKGKFRHYQAFFAAAVRALRYAANNGRIFPQTLTFFVTKKITASTSTFVISSSKIFMLL